MRNGDMNQSSASVLSARALTVFLLNHIISSHHGVVRLGQAVSPLLLMKSFLNIQDGNCLNDNESFLDFNVLLDLVQEVLCLLCMNNLLVLQACSGPRQDKIGIILRPRDTILKKISRAIAWDRPLVGVSICVEVFSLET